MKNVVQENEKVISGAIKIDEKGIRVHWDGSVRQSGENTLNASETNVRKNPDTTANSNDYGITLHARKKGFSHSMIQKSSCPTIL